MAPSSQGARLTLQNPAKGRLWHWWPEPGPIRAKAARMTLYDRYNAWAAALIPGFAAADGPPPRQMFPFMRWALSGSGGVLVLGGVLACLAGTTEVVSAMSWAGSSIGPWPHRAVCGPTMRSPLC